MPDLDRSHEVVLGLLAHRGIASSDELQKATGKSQATVSRLIADLADRVVALGRARATRYGLLKPIRGLPAVQPVLWTDEAGGVNDVGRLSFLAGDRVHVDAGFEQASAANSLPWFLAPLRAQGFLGRLHAQRLGAGLTGDPDQWNLETVIYSALHLHDAPGAITLGQLEAPSPAEPLPAAAAALLDALDRHADDVAKMLPAGSSAGGEQPKFIAVAASGTHLLVKFTPPRGTPFGERWHELLHAEALASDVLAQHGVTVARTRVHESARRTYLVSERFDRVGARGRRHVVAIGDVHKAFVADAYANWAMSAQALARQRRLSDDDARRAAALLAFGRLIGNSDMHAGNLGLLVGRDDLARGRFRLAPVYDMLPMRWRPDPLLGGAPDYAPFEPDAASLSSGAVRPAADFWARLAEHQHVGAALRSTAAQMARRIASA